ncbi:MAG: hypothetical protein EOO71_24520 [Myxococcaceae bacterium]|nr:MAG: hypothetical protein EOO71_24520 [Myxococcaceae bacterium]
MSPAFDVGSCSGKELRDYQRDAVDHQPIPAALFADVVDGLVSYEGSKHAAKAAVWAVPRCGFGARGLVARSGPAWKLRWRMHTERASRAACS